MKYVIFDKEDFNKNNIKRTDVIEFNCINCGKLCTINSFRKQRIPRYKTLLCEDCYREQESLKKWGTDKPQRSDAVKKITEEHNISKFGKPYVYTYGSEEWIENMKKKHGEDYRSKIGFGSEKCYETMNERYGASVWKQSEDAKQRLPEIVEKAKSTCSERYGVNSYSKTDEFIEKKMNTSLERFGVPYYQQLPEAREHSSKLHIMHPEWGSKAAETNRENHGGLHYTQTEEFKEAQRERTKNHPEWIQQSLKNNKDNHNGKLFVQTSEFKDLWKENPEWIDKSIENKTHSKLVFSNQSFDSSIEFYVYLFCYYNCIPIIRNPSVRFEYKDMDNKIHFTYPDFCINGQLVEIKGRQFYNEDGTWKFPYKKEKDDNGNWVPITEEHKEYMDDLYERKRKCLIENNVLILKDNDPWIQMCISYVKTILNCKLYNTKYFGNVCYGHTPFSIDYSKDYADPIGPGMTPFDIEGLK